MVLRTGLFQWMCEAKHTTQVNKHTYRTENLGLCYYFHFVCGFVCVCRAILGQNSPPGDSTQMFPAECGSESVRRLIKMDRKQFYSHSLIGSGVILEQTDRKAHLISQVLYI